MKDALVIISISVGAVVGMVVGGIALLFIVSALAQWLAFGFMLGVVALLLLSAYAVVRNVGSGSKVNIDPLTGTPRHPEK